MAYTTIDSWEQLQAQVATLLEKVHSDSMLSVAAASNPLLALEDLGYAINPEARLGIEDRIRFDLRTVVRLRQLREQIFHAAGHPFDINSRTELERVLFDELGTTPANPEPESRGRSRRRRLSLDPLPPQVGWGQKVADPLEELRGRHPVVELLLEYRRLDASEPRLASRELYESIRNGTRKTPLVKARGVLRQPNAADR